MRKERFNWNLLLELVGKYREDANRCMNVGAYFAGLVSVRAALETLLYARFLLELFDEEPAELQKYGVKITGAIIEISGGVNLHVLIQEAHNQGLLNKTGFKAAERIRIWGNKIHCSQVASGMRLPNIGRKNLQARLNDLATVSDQLLETL